MSTSYLLGVGVGLALCLVVRIFFKKKLDMESRCAQLDERQQMVNGKAYKAAWFTLVFVELVYSIISSAIEKVYVESMVATFACICISILVFAGYSIFNDSYYGINDRYKKYIRLFGIMGIMFAVVAVIKIARGQLFDNGVIGDTGMYIVSAILMIGVVIMTFIHNAMNKNAED
jgi:hypothetical protein